MSVSKRWTWLVGIALAIASACPAQMATVRLGKGPPAGGPAATVLPSEGGEGVLRFDLSALPKDAKVLRADLVVTRSRALSSADPQRLTDIEIHPLFEEAKSGTAPAAGSKPLQLRGPWFDRFDATEAVRAWTTGKPNAGFFVKAFPLWDKQASHLDVAYQGQAKDVPTQASGLKVFHRSGQTFITWKEIADPVGKDQIRWGDMAAILNGLDQAREVRYCIYRSTRPIDAKTLAEAECIAQVAPLSCWNVNARNRERPRDEVIAALHSAQDPVRFWVDDMKGSPEECPIDRFVIEQGAPAGAPAEPLPSGTGLYVHTAGEKAKAYYAVATMVNGVQNTSDFTPDNALRQPVAEEPGDPAPVLQRKLPPRPVWDYRHTRYQYVQWASPPLGNLPCQSYNWLVCVPDPPAKTYPLELNLPEPGSSWYRAPYRIEVDSIIVVPHDFPLQTWYYGYHESEGTLKSLRQGVIHNYTQRRMLAFLDWVGRAYPVDRNRISVAGNGLVAGSGALHLGLRRHQTFNLVMSLYGCPDFRGAILKFRELGDVRKVPGVDRTFKVTCPQAAIEQLLGKTDWDIKADSGASVWDELNLTKWVNGLPATTDLPVVTYAGQGGFESDRDFRLAMLDKGHLLIADFNVYGNSFFIPISMTAGLTGTIRVEVRKDLSHPAVRDAGADMLLKPPQLATGELVVSDGTRQWWGEFNQNYRWSNVVDQPDRYEITLEFRGRAPARCDVTPRRLQKFHVEKGKAYLWQFKTTLPDRQGDKEIVQNGEASLNDDGLLKIPRLPITSRPGRLVITPK